VVAIGTLIRSKGHDVTLRSIAELSSEFPRLRCRIVGEGPELVNLQNLAQQLGIAERVEFVGRQTRTEIAAILRGAQIFALPSHYEGLGCVYLEAMASGLPVIAYRGQGIQEMIRHNDNGILLSEQTPENAPRALAAVLRTLLKNDEMRRKMGLSARRTIVGGYTLRHQAQGLARIFENVRREYLA
jgi:glycosyltransferase involved in cell wall biosynthesis